MITPGTLPHPASNQNQVSAPPLDRVPGKKRIIQWGLGLLLIVFLLAYYSIAKDSAARDREARVERLATIEQMHGIIERQISERQKKIEALTVKEKVLIQYAGELRNSLIGNDGSVQLAQAERLADDIAHLDEEISNLEKRRDALQVEKKRLK